MATTKEERDALWRGQTLEQQAQSILDYLRSEPEQTVVPSARVDLLEQTLASRTSGGFLIELTRACNGQERPSNTSDHVLGCFLLRCKEAYDQAVVETKRLAGEDLTA